MYIPKTFNLFCSKFTAIHHVRQFTMCGSFLNRFHVLIPNLQILKGYTTTSESASGSSELASPLSGVQPSP